MLSFKNTKIAFASRSNRDIRRAKFLFTSISWPWLVSLGKFFLELALAIGFPIAWFIKPTIFKQFVGGENLLECIPVVENLSQFGINSILDYSVEGKGTLKSQNNTYDEVLRSVNFAATNPNITFAVFKPTGLVSINLLEKVSSKQPLTDNEKEEYDIFYSRVDKLCETAHTHNTPLLIDAEDSWYQQAIDTLVHDMMRKYNKSKAIVYNTFQMYRTDRLDFLKASYTIAAENSYKYGAKLVRGAYMEKERERALQMGYPSPIHSSKAETDNAFNAALDFCFNNLDTISIFCGTHNEESTSYLAQIMEEGGISKTDSRITFSQLYGMSDHISFTLGHFGYNVAKYIPYGPVKKVMPYLLRRAQENTSVKGQTGRELKLLKQELTRRKKIAVNNF